MTLYDCDSDSFRSFRLLKALAKSNSNLFAIASKNEKEQVGRAITLERAIKKRSKELIT